MRRCSRCSPVVSRGRIVPAFFALTILIAACSSAGEGTDREAVNPDGTFRRLLRSIEERDIDLYTSCFTDDANQHDESELSAYRRNPEAFWNRMAETFRGPQTLDITSNDGETARGHVTAPEAAGGGIGSILFRKVGGSWKIRSW